MEARHGRCNPIPAIKQRDVSREGQIKEEGDGRNRKRRKKGKGEKKREHTDRVIAFRLGHVAAKSICNRLRGGRQKGRGRSWRTKMCKEKGAEEMVVEGTG